MGSEHKIDGAYTDMEMQMVFFDRRCIFFFSDALASLDFKLWVGE